jgi:hypothetical protein
MLIKSVLTIHQSRPIQGYGIGTVTFDADWHDIPDETWR